MELLAGFCNLGYFSAKSLQEHLSTQGISLGLGQIRHELKYLIKEGLILKATLTLDTSWRRALDSLDFKSQFSRYSSTRYRLTEKGHALRHELGFPCGCREN